VGFMALGDVADYLIGLVVERVWPQASLLIFLALYFVSLWIAWLLAVKRPSRKPANKPQGDIRYPLSQKRVRFCCGPLGARIPLVGLVNSILPMGASARPYLCKAGMNILPRWKSRRTCVKFGLLG